MFYTAVIDIQKIFNNSIQAVHDLNRRRNKY